MAEEVGQEARAAGDWVVMGCPNVVRGGSHLGWASAARMAEAGICNVLSSDYYLSGDVARGDGAGGAGRARSAARLGIDLGQSGGRGGA